MASVADILNIRELKNGKPLSEKAIEKLAAAQNVLQQIQGIAERKTKGLGGGGVDTGPIAQFIPETVSSFWNENIAGVPADQAGDRAKLKQDLLYFSNPVRKDVTGSQSSLDELKNFIFPMLPSMGDNDTTFNAKLMNAAKKAADKFTTERGMLKSSGYNVPSDLDVEALLNSLQGTLFPSKK